MRSKETMEVVLMPIEKLKLNPRNVRDETKEYDLEEKKMKDLVENIRLRMERKQGLFETGIVNALLVFKNGGKNEYIVHFGNRRYVASKHIGLKGLPCIIASPPKDQAQDVFDQMAENVNRKYPDPMERGKAYCQIMKTYKLNAETVQKETGDSDADACIAMFREQERSAEVTGAKRVNKAITELKKRRDYSKISRIVWKRHNIHPEDKVTLTEVLCQEKASALAGEVVAKQLQNETRSDDKPKSEAEIRAMVLKADKVKERTMYVSDTTWHEYEKSWKIAKEQGLPDSETQMLYMRGVLDKALDKGIGIVKEVVAKA